MADNDSDHQDPAYKALKDELNVSLRDGVTLVAKGFHENNYNLKPKDEGTFLGNIFLALWPGKRVVDNNDNGAQGESAASSVQRSTTGGYRLPLIPHGEFTFEELIEWEKNARRGNNEPVISPHQQQDAESGRAPTVKPALHNNLELQRYDGPAARIARRDDSFVNLLQPASQLRLTEGHDDKDVAGVSGEEDLAAKPE